MRISSVAAGTHSPFFRESGGLRHRLISAAPPALSVGHPTVLSVRRQADRMRKAGKSRGEVASALGVHLKTITRWSGEHQKRGAAAFSVRKRGRSAVGRSPRLAKRGT